MKAKKVFDVITDVLLTILLIIMAIAIVWIVFFRTSKEAPTIFGISMYVVATPSMEPTISVGDIIFNKEYKGEDLEVGEIITYYGKTGTYKDKRITHRIIAVDNETGAITTQGDNNNDVADPPISKEDVVGVLLYKTVFLGKAYQFLMKPIGFILIIILPMTVFILKEILNAIKIAKQQKADEAQEAIDEQARKWIAEREEAAKSAEGGENASTLPDDTADGENG